MCENSDSRRVTPKVFANFSPGLSFGNPGDKTGDCFCRNPEGIATVCVRRAPPFQGCAFPSNDIRDPRVAKAQPWAEIGEHLRCREETLCATSAFSASLRLKN